MPIERSAQMVGTVLDYSQHPVCCSTTEELAAGFHHAFRRQFAVRRDRATERARVTPVMHDQVQHKHEQQHAPKVTTIVAPVGVSSSTLK